MPLSDIFMENYRVCCSNSKTRLKVKTMAQDKCLEFNADRLEADDWKPLLKALRSDRRLHSLAIKSEFPDRRNKNSRTEQVPPPFHKQSIIDEIVDSVVGCMKHSEILSTVQLQSLPLNRRHVQLLAEAVRACPALQNLLLTKFALRDDGLKTLYESIHDHLGINRIDFSGCQLTVNAAHTIAKLIRTQRLARYDETWKHSLRYREPEQEHIPGIRRITLNDNPAIGDEGFQVINHEVIDDLWIKAVDFQNCGLTSESGERALEMVKINDTISVVDLSRNDKINSTLKKQIKQVLVEKEQREKRIIKENEEDVDAAPQVYDWIDSKSLLTDRSGSRKRNSTDRVTPISSRYRDVDRPDLTVELHETKKELSDTKRDLIEEREKREELENAKKMQRDKLAERFTKEWHKRKQIEKERDRLKEELHEFMSEGQLPRIIRKIKSAKSTSAVKTKESKSKKIKKVKSKAKPIDGVIMTPSTANATAKAPKKSPAKKKVKKCLKPQTAPQAKPAVRSETVKEEEVSNTNELHLMQTNLDKLIFNAKPESVAEEVADPSESESESDAESVHSNSCQTVDYESDSDNSLDTKETQPLNPADKSKFIFNEIVHGKRQKKY